MKTAIVGAGPAGAVLARLLKSRGETFELYDKPTKTACGLKPCAWGMRAVKYGEYCKELGLNPRDYCLRHYGTVSIQGVHFKRGLVMLDKLKFLGDLVSGIDVVPKEFGGFDGFDRVIDATGMGGIAGNHNGNHNFHQTFQIRAKGHILEPAVYVDPEDSRSLMWLFPLGDGTVHIGVMALLGHRQPDMEQVDRLVGHYKLDIGTVQCACNSRIWAGGIREPVVSGNVWHIGESGGFVDPISGSGMAPAFTTAFIAFKNWHSPDAYADEVRQRFAYCNRGAQFARVIAGGSRPSCAGILGYLRHGDLRGVPLTPFGVALLALVSKEFRRFALPFGLALFGNHKEYRIENSDY